MGSAFKKFMFFILAFLTLNLLVSVMFGKGSDENIKESTYSEFITMVEEKDIESVVFNGANINYTLKNKMEGTTKIPQAIGDDDLLNELLKNDVVVEDKTRKEEKSLLFTLLGFLPTLLFLGFFIMLLKQQQGMKNMTSLKKQIFKGNINNLTFDDVAGCDEAKQEVMEVVDFLKHPEKYRELGAKIPHGVLFEGSPGNGKTLLAKAVAGEAGVPFIPIAGSDFVEKFVGVGASRVRELFEAAKNNAPCIIFIDEIDAIGGQRSSGGGGGDSEREQTLNQLLVEMDGFGSEHPVIVIAATNRADMLDSALKRPGRFDRKIHIGLPDVKGREEILKVHARGKKIVKDVDFRVIAQGTAGFSGADLANLVNEAAIFSVRDSKPFIDKDSFDKAKDKIIMGNARTNFVMKEKEKSLTSYHEAGHAIIGWHMEQLGLHDPVYKVSIIPRERALGVTVYLPEEDKYSLTRGEALARITTLYGGRIAEEMVGDGFDNVTTGASNDIERATSYATKMVTNWGLSSLGNGVRQFKESDPRSEKPFVSSKTGENIDNEIQTILDACYGEAEKLLHKYSKELEVMHDALMVNETITQEEVNTIMNGGVLTEYHNFEESFKVKDRIYDLEKKRESSKSPIQSMVFSGLKKQPE